MGIHDGQGEQPSLKSPGDNPISDSHPDVYHDERMGKVFDERRDQQTPLLVHSYQLTGHPLSYGLTLQVSNGTTLYDIACFCSLGFSTIYLARSG